LAPGVSLKQAQSEFQGIAAALAAAYPSANKGWSIRVLPALDQVVSDVRPQLWLLAAAAFCLLLIAVANVTSLLLTQAVGRRSELATRAAMGASRAHLARQLLTEGIVLAALSGLIGIPVAYWTVPMLVAQAPSSIPRLAGVSVDVGVLLFAVGLTMTWALLCGLGLAASVHPSRLAPAFALRSGNAIGRTGRIRQSLAVGQVALAMMLVVAAGLLVRTTQSLGAVRLGFDPRNVIAVDLNPGNFRQAARFQADFVDQVRSLPGVIAIGSGRRPLTGGPTNLVRLAVDGPGEQIGLEAVSPGYMAALRMQVVRGRVFEAGDQAAGRVAIVNESAARHLWGELDPVGRSVFIDDPPREASVVGVVADVIKRGLERPYEPIVYVLPLQETSVFYPTVLVRASGDPHGLVPAVSAVLRRMDPEQPLTKVQTLDEILADAMAPRRFMLELVGLFSALALGLSMLGIYGVLSETVAQRVPELGVRVALGATRGRIVTMILSHGALIVGIGITLGVAGAFASRQLMSTLVFGVTPADRTTYALACIGVLVAALLACWIPAQRAATIDPVTALRHE
jgi:predicted permease